MEFIFFAAAGFVLTFAGIKFFLGWLNKKEIFDIPNERSSHQNPTPVGGGIVIALVSLTLFSIYLIYSGEKFYWGYFFGALIIAFISWLDDLRSVPVLARFFCHSLAAVLAIYSFGIDESLYIPLIGNYNFGKFIYLVWFLWIVWLINAYNFMDGIDGIAGIQALITSISWVVVANSLGNNSVGIFCLVLAASNLAFLFFNWQPAKIFMGDVGSAFLGYTFAVLPLFALAGKKAGNNPGFLPFAGVLFVWLFFFDTVRTFFIRLIKRERFWQAHRKHIYQQFIIKGYAHRSVTILYGVITFLICLLSIIYFLEGFINEFILITAVLFFSAFIQIVSFYVKPKNLGI